VAIRSPDGHWSARRTDARAGVARFRVRVGRRDLRGWWHYGGWRDDSFRYYDVRRRGWGRLTPMPEVRYYGSDAAIIVGASTCSAVGTICRLLGRFAARRRVLFDLHKKSLAPVRFEVGRRLIGPRNGVGHNPGGDLLPKDCVLARL